MKVTRYKRDNGWGLGIGFLKAKIYTGVWAPKPTYEISYVIELALFNQCIAFVWYKVETNDRVS